MATDFLTKTSGPKNCQNQSLHNICTGLSHTSPVEPEQVRILCRKSSSPVVDTQRSGFIAQGLKVNRDTCTYEKLIGTDFTYEIGSDDEKSVGDESHDSQSISSIDEIALLNMADGIEFIPDEKDDHLFDLNGLN